MQITRWEDEKELTETWREGKEFPEPDIITEARASTLYLLSLAFVGRGIPNSPYPPCKKFNLFWGDVQRVPMDSEDTINPDGIKEFRQCMRCMKWQSRCRVPESSTDVKRLIYDLEEVGWGVA